MRRTGKRQFRCGGCAIAVAVRLRFSGRWVAGELGKGVGRLGDGSGLPKLPVGAPPLDFVWTTCTPTSPYHLTAATTNDEPGAQ